MEIEKVFNIKRELIKRDPTFNELTKIFHKIVDARRNIKSPSTKFKKVKQKTPKGYPFKVRVVSMPPDNFRIDDPILDDIKKYYATPFCPNNIREDHEKQYPDHWKLLRLEGEICYKWHVNLQFDYLRREIELSSYTHDEVIWVGNPPSGYDKYPSLEWLPYPNPFKKKPILIEMNEFVTPGYKWRGNWVPIVIDASRLNKNDSAEIKRLVWEIILKNLQKGNSKKPHDEYPECAFLYSLRSGIFEQYLKWYDLHLRDERKGLSFREIARYCLLETLQRERPDKQEQVKQQVTQFRILDKKIQKTIENLIGKKIKIVWEDAIETAVKTLYKAIHRKPYPVKKKAKLFTDCPIHGAMENCPKECPHFINNMKVFDNRISPRLRQHDTIEDIDAKIEDPKHMRNPAKGKSSKIIGQQKKEEQEGKKYFPKFPF